MLEHRLSLVVEAPVSERSDQVTDGFPLNTDVWCQDVIAYCQLAGDYDHAISVEQGWKGASEFADINDNSGRGGCCGKPTTSRYASVHSAKKLFLRIIKAFIMGYCKGHVLVTC